MKEDIIMLLLLFILLFILGYAAYDFFFIKDEIICLGGHYELRYKPELKRSMNVFICDSAKIIYK